MRRRFCLCGFKGIQLIFPHFCAGFHLLIGFSQDIIRICQLPPDTKFDYPWTLRKVPIGENVDYLTYSPSSETYVLGTSHKTEFKLPEDDELHPEWRNEGSFDYTLCEKYANVSQSFRFFLRWTKVRSK